MEKIMANIEKILSKCDHTLLGQTATWEQMKKICDEGMLYHTASVCIPPSYVKQAKEYVGDKLAICTVIGFPNGYNTTAVKVFETKDAIANGADEIDMVINIGKLRQGLDDEVCEEIRQIKAACGEKILKVIIETCLLTEEEKIRMCKIVTTAGADYIKTSTGFSTAGATLEDVRLMRANVGEKVLVKAAGGISGLEDAENFLTAGADRLGTSRVVKAVQGIEGKGY
jgi:deoxyribose-phosphate aldolase